MFSFAFKQLKRNLEEESNKSPDHKFSFDHQDLIDRYDVSGTQLASDMFSWTKILV